MSVIFFILLLFVIVVIHELGHLIAAKAFGVYCHEFSFGMGPLLFKKKGKETTYSVRLFPIGGYVSMAGDTENELEQKFEKELPPERTLTGIHPLKRLVIIYAGIIMNIILALIISSMVFLSYGEAAVSPDATIAKVMEDSVAYKAGIQEGDKIISMKLPDGSEYPIDYFSDLTTYFSLYDGEGSINFTIIRNDEKLNIDIKPQYDASEERYLIGIQANEFQSVNVNIFNCFKYGFSYIVNLSVAIISALLNIFRGSGLANLSGPVGIYTVTSEAVSMGLDTYLLLIAMVSLNVGLFNFLPIPVMDGGRGLLIIIEMIIGRPINKKVSDTIMTISVVLLLALFVILTTKDIIGLFWGNYD